MIVAMNIRKITTILTLAFCMGMIVFIVFGKYYHASTFQVRDRLDFPFEFSEGKAPYREDRWGASVLLTPDYYNRANLEKLFLWFSRRHPDKRELLMVTVYTDRQSYDTREQESERFVKWMALCFRKGDGIDGGGNNLQYSFVPDLSHPHETKYVVLRGGTYHNGSGMIEIWENGNGSFKVSTSAYNLSSDTEPRGIYYTFSGSTLSKENDHKQTIFTIRHDKTVPIPRDNVVFINDKIGYVYMGWLFAVTIDGGITWHQWDAETELSDWQCCDPDLIQNVTIASSGSGTMTLKAKLQQQEKVLMLHTKDYGLHWLAN